MIQKDEEEVSGELLPVDVSRLRAATKSENVGDSPRTDSLPNSIAHMAEAKQPSKAAIKQKERRALCGARAPPHP